MRIASYVLELDQRRGVLVKRNAVNYKVNNLNRADLIVSMMNDLYGLYRKAEEYVYMVAMDNKCHVIGVFMLSKGTVNASIVSPRDIFTRLCLCSASCFVMVHNHPSGDTTPSNDDIRTTKRVKECAELMNIQFVDHLIIGSDYYSFKDNGYL